MNYKDLEVWQIARELSIDIHKMTLTLPKFEMYETGRRSEDLLNQFDRIWLKDTEDEDIKMNLSDLLLFLSPQQMKR